MVRKLLMVLGVLVILIIAAAFAAPMLIPKDWLREQITAQVKDATGRDLVIGGDLNLQLLPSAVVNLSDVKFSNAAGGSRPDMATLKELRVHVAVLPLLSSEIEVKEFVLVEPDILLEVDKNGHANWAVGSGGGAEGAGGKSGGTGGGSGLDRLKLGDVRLVDGKVEYRDAKSGTVEKIEGLNITISLPDLDSPLAVDGSLQWHGEALDLKLGAAKPRALAEGDASPLTLALKGKPLNLSFNGSLDAGAQSAGGKVTLDVPSVRGLAEWAGAPLDIQGDVLGPLNISGDLSATATNVAFKGITLAIDAIKGTGGLSAALGGKVPGIKAELALEDLNLNPYLEAFGGGKDGAQPAAKPAKNQEWSDEPIDLSALKLVNADLTLTTKLLQVQDIKIDGSAVGVKLNGGKLAVDLSKLALYGGTGVATLNVDASGKTPAVSHTFSLSGFQARPFLTDAAKMEWLAGTANLNLDVTTRGISQKTMVSALNGKGDFKFLDGSIYGINLAAMVRNAATAFLSKSDETVKTDFAELSGTYTITNGLVKNDDLKMLSPLLRVSGKGTSDMPSKTVNYRVEPKAVASLQGQGGAGDLSGIAVPVIVEGPWDNLSFRPDLTGAITDIAKDPGKILDGAKDLAKDPGSALKNLVPGGSDSGSGSSGGSTNPLQDGANKLKGLFGK